MEETIECRVAARGGGEVRFDLVRLNPGVFLMGSPEDEADRTSAEGPRTRVTLTREFWLGKTQVAQELWDAVLGAESNPSHFKGARLPVERVTWDEALGFAGALQLRCGDQAPRGARFTLPTEAQWEYACRAGAEGPYAGPLGEMAWYCETSGGTTHPVGTKKANAWGIHDLHGNVWEWCLDLKAEALPGGHAVDPAGPPAGTERARRGGSWKGVAGDARSACRRWSLPTARGRGLGFRMALVA